MSSQDNPQVAVDRELVRRILVGDRRAFDEFTDDYVPQLYRFASRRLDGNREATAEVVQSTVCKALAKLATFRGEAALMTWLCAVCRNEIAAHFRHLRRRRAETDFADAEQATPAKVRHSTYGVAGFENPERLTAQRESAARVHDLLDQLPPHYARVLEMKYLKDLPVREIAAHLEVSDKAAESLLTRARKAFRASWGELAVPAEPVPETASVTGVGGSR